MNILVCVKRVPDTTEAEVIIAKDGRSIEEGTWSLTSMNGTNMRWRRRSS